MSRRHIATAALLGCTASLAGAAAAQADGSLVSYPLVYRLPPSGDASVAYAVIFRTKGSFIGHDSVGTSVPGELALEDSTDNHDGLSVIGGRRNCYLWGLADTSELKRKRVGDRVHLRFKLHKTSVQRRTVTLRRAPAKLRSASGKRWYDTGSAAQQLSWIGCGASR